MARMGFENWGKAVTHFECELLKAAGDLSAAKASATQLRLQAEDGDGAALQVQPAMDARVEALLARRDFLAELVVEMRQRHVDMIAEEAA